MIQLLIAILLGLAIPSTPNKTNSQGGTFIPTYTSSADSTSTGTGGNNGQLPPPPITGG